MELITGRKNLKRLYAEAPKEHKIHSFVINPRDNPITFTEIFLQNNIPIVKKPDNRKFYIPYLLEVLREKDNTKKWFRINMLGVSFRFHVKKLKK